MEKYTSKCAGNIIRQKSHSKYHSKVWTCTWNKAVPMHIFTKKHKTVKIMFLDKDNTWWLLTHQEESLTIKTNNQKKCEHAFCLLCLFLHLSIDSSRYGQCVGLLDPLFIWQKYKENIIPYNFNLVDIKTSGVWCLQHSLDNSLAFDRHQTLHLLIFSTIYKVGPRRKWNFVLLSVI